jgi:alkylation response protein AidB-like acyl-CoA dehydrogenase
VLYGDLKAELAHASSLPDRCAVTQPNVRFRPIATFGERPFSLHCGQSEQLLDGASYMNEYLIARLWRDARVTGILVGTNEIMKEVVSRAI